MAARPPASELAAQHTAQHARSSQQQLATNNRLNGIRPKELGPQTEHDDCKKEYDCSAGCISIMGNGAITRGQAVMALQCGDIYRANFMNSAKKCAHRTTHCFFRLSSILFHGLYKTDDGVGVPRNRYVDCPHTIFVNAGPEKRNMTWNHGTYETSITPRHKVLVRVWSHVNAKRKSEGKLSRPRGPLGNQPSTGLHMMAYALEHRKDRCIHLFGFNFQRVMVNGTWGHTIGHEWVLDKRLFAALTREEKGIFYHPPPYDIYHFDNEPAFGLRADGSESENGD